MADNIGQFEQYLRVIIGGRIADVDPVFPRYGLGLVWTGAMGDGADPLVPAVRDV